MFTLGEIIDLAIRIEKNGESTYRKAQKEVSSSKVSAMLEWLADDEAKHEKWFTELRENVDEKRCSSNNYGVMSINNFMHKLNQKDHGGLEAYSSCDSKVR